MKGIAKVNAAGVALVLLVLIGALAAPAVAESKLTCEEWATKLDGYKADTNPGSKGRYGCPMSEAAPIVEAKPAYDEAKKAYDEFKQTGMNPDDCWQLRQAEYDARIAIENYEHSITRVVEEAENAVKQNQEFLDRDPKNAQMLDKGLREGMNAKVAAATSLLAADDPKLVALKAKLDKLNAKLAEGEKAKVARIRVKPDVYKGKDAAALKAKAKAIVLKEHPKAQILRMSVTKTSWERESVIEATDTTNTALEHRLTNGIYAQVAAKEGSDVTLYTIYLHRDKIGGKQGELAGHVMYTDKMLEENVKK